MRGRGRLIMWANLMTDGASKTAVSLRTTPRPLITIFALPDKINANARRIGDTCNGSNVTFKINTGSYKIDCLFIKMQYTKEDKPMSTPPLSP